MLAPINKIYDRVESFFLKSDLWIFVTVMTAVSLIMTLESEPYSVGTFMTILLGMSLVFLPTFWFIHVRQKLKAQLSRWKYRGLWSFIFGLYPWLAAGLVALIAEGDPPVILNSLDDVIVGTAVTGITLFGTAAVLHGLVQNSWLPDVRKRISHHFSPTTIIGVFSVLAAMLAVASNSDFGQISSEVNDLILIGIFLSAVVQVLLVYLPYL
ncbi:MAG: hypothetical protein ACI9K9_002197, partial [Neolewinella sp.]